ncbi:MAG: acetyl-CoA carboxylase biotin carboxylase subunit [Thermoanaerobaculia bacterium]|nr:acetyl-CoA carboxylase biotin carboxylase subunit [Thermoanaerobaculia bacterium]
MKILIANRGEIAIRIIRACRELGYSTVAVYSEPDRSSLHVLQADEAVPVGPAPSSESYLRVDRIIEAAKKTGADAIHPGYGFLAENATFSETCREEGIIFIGPSTSAIRVMGSKTESRQLMEKAGVPVVPGLTRPVEGFEELVDFASSSGYPVMLKASAGGGGKGMRIVHDEDALKKAYERVSSEAASFFGDPSVYAERAILAPRHIEVQVLGDQHGNVIHLGERECTLQRRHQKVIEECPSPVTDEETREKIGAIAVKAASAVSYDSAGTVELLRDEKGDFFFLEMNTRLQVEHPVTELVTGVDLVKEQIRIAQGERLSLTQDEVRLRGHAIECRIYAEDPYRNFAPSPGLIRNLMLPSGPGVRNDNGVYSGYRVPLHYDPMLSKLITFGADRDEAIQRMKRALREYRVDGIQTTIPFYLAMMDNEDFRAGNFDTGFIDRYLDEFAHPEVPDEYVEAAIVVAAIQTLEDSEKVSLPKRRESKWKLASRAEHVRGRL